MPPHQQRVVTERDELTEKITRLAVFMDGEVFSGLPRDEQYRLHIQHGFMVAYCDVLEDRIDHFNK